MRSPHTNLRSCTQFPLQMLLCEGFGIPGYSNSTQLAMVISYAHLVGTPITNMQGQWVGQPVRFRIAKKFPRKTVARHARASAGLEEIFQNKVLLAAGVASVIGQLSKPVASALTGKGLDWRLVIKSGGMPSSHSAGIVATATAIGLERGFADSLFGLSVVIAGIVMYDAQGVRRAVGKQAEVINMIISDTSCPVNSCNDKIFLVNMEDPVSGSFQRQLNSVAASDSKADMTQVAVSSVERIKSTTTFSEETQASGLRSTEIMVNNEDYQVVGGTKESSSFEPLQTLPDVKYDSVNHQQLVKLGAWRHIPLKESVGHTKVEVLGGALIGLIVTLMLHWTV